MVLEKEFAASFLVHYDNLLQNATEIIAKYDSYFITKCGEGLLLQNASGVLLQNATAFYTMHRFYYKRRRLSENMTFTAKCAGTIDYSETSGFFCNLKGVTK